jgi:hypothetical protein
MYSLADANERFRRARSSALWGLVASVISLVTLVCISFYEILPDSGFLSFFIKGVVYISAFISSAVMYFNGRTLEGMYDSMNVRGKIAEGVARYFRITGQEYRISFDDFFWSKNLFDFERAVVKHCEDLEKKFLEKKRRELDLARCKEMARIRSDLSTELMELLDEVSGVDRVAYMRLHKRMTISVLKDLIIDLRSKQSRSVNDHDRKVKNYRATLAELASANMCERAHQMILEADLSDDPKVQRDFLKMAITVQKEANARLNRLISKRARVQVVSPVLVNEYRFDELEKRIELEYDLDPLLPDWVDKVMVKQILVVLMDPGKQVHLFGSNYRPYSTIKGYVVDMYRTMGLRFSPQSFDESLKWLVSCVIVLTKSKRDERTYSINSRPNECVYEFARKILVKTHVFERAIKS